MAKKKKINKSSIKKEVIDIPDTMPLTKAIITNDLTLFKKYIQSSPIPNLNLENVTSMKCVQSVGERLTKGTSTPVYMVDIESGGKVLKFILKFIKLLERSNPTFLEKSYEIENNFYQDNLIKTAIQENNIVIPTLYTCEMDRRSHFISFFMNDLSEHYTYHPEAPSLIQAQYALDWLAKWHSCFWMKPWQWPKKLWDNGNFWVLGKKGKDNLSSIPSTWNLSLKFIQKKHSEILQEQGFKNFGKRIQEAASSISTILATSKYRTIIHGDFKPANIFFSEEKCAVCDFQFSGPGSPFHDIMYFLFPDALMNFSGEEENLLKYYFERLTEYGITNISWEDGQKWYKLCTLDYLRYLLEKGWVCSTEHEVNLLKQCNTWLSCYDQYLLIDKESYMRKLNTEFN